LLGANRWRIEQLQRPKEDIAAYRDTVLEDGDPDLSKAALGDIARAKGMTEIAKAVASVGLICTTRYRRTVTRSSRPLPGS